MSLRATGEGHISSITFRSGVIDAGGRIRLDEPTQFVQAPELVPNALYEKALFHRKLAELERIRAERFKLMNYMAQLPGDLNFFTQITMEAAEDGDFLDAMKKANIKGALVGVEAVTAEGLKGLFKDFNYSGENLVQQLQKFRDHGVHVLGSFIFGLPTDQPDTFQATAQLAIKANIAFAQFVMLTPFPGTVDFQRWEKEQGEQPATVAGIPVTRYWLIPPHQRPKMFMPHPSMSSEEMRLRTQCVWDTFYSFGAIWKRSTCTTNFRARLAFVFASKLYRQMYASTGITTDSARRKKSTSWARWIAVPCRKLFEGKPMPALTMPALEGAEVLGINRHFQQRGGGDLFWQISGAGEATD